MRLRQLLTVAALLIVSAGPATRSAEPQRLRVVATNSILADMVREVGGERVAVIELIPADRNAHGFEPGTAELRALANADLVVVNGFGLEGWIDRAVEASGYRGTVVTATAGVAPRAAPEGGGTPDPHAWQDLRNGRVYAANIAHALAAADPADAGVYAEREERYLARIDAMDEWVRQQLADVPADRRRVVSSHDAFGYFGAAYGIEFLAPEGIAEDAEPSARAMTELLRQIERERIKVVFLESALSPRLIEQVARDAGARIGGTLYADSLSPADGPAASYLGMFSHNLSLLRAAMLASGGG